MTSVDFLGQFGDDLMVVNAARVSYDRTVTTLSKRDQALIQRLARDGHTSPFYHPQAQFRISAPLYVAAQFKRHHVGFAWNELEPPLHRAGRAYRNAVAGGQGVQGSVP